MTQVLYAVTLLGRAETMTLLIELLALQVLGIAGLLHKIIINFYNKAYK